MIIRFASYLKESEMTKTISLLLIALGFRLLYAQSAIPKREFRGVWIATVVNLDWPKSQTPSIQKQELIDMLDNLRKSGFNAVIFQVRPECDAFYQSNYEPWSYYLTGQQGKAPSPYYDPLQFAIDEAHKRGMELHAWFNPYRAVRAIGDYPISSEHVSVRHPEWIITKGSFKSLDPGLPAVRNYVTEVIMDVVENYDVDGVHFDDYFYPEGMTDADDQTTFDTYPNGFTDRGDWRRNNVNLLVAQVFNAIQDTKPYVKFGISPAGIWKNGVPSGIYGRSAYSAIYCDALAWLQQKTVDYINPQCYWEFGGDQDYAKLISWWATQANGRHVFSGNAGYRINSSFTAEELPNQIRYNRNTAHIEGSVIFRALNGVLDNQRGFNDSLQLNLFRHPALIPAMEWKDVIAPNIPGELKYTQMIDHSGAVLKWSVPQIASDGDSASRYVLYRFDHNSFSEEDLEDSQNIISIEGNTYAQPQEPADNGPYYFVVSALDHNWNESPVSNVLEVQAPEEPMLISPIDKARGQRDTVRIVWQGRGLISSYLLQIDDDSLFDEPLFGEENRLADTTYILSGMNGQTTYYWRVLAKNAGGTGNFTEAFSFYTGFPVQAQLLYPEHKSSGIENTPTLFWKKQNEARTYNLQLAISNDFSPEKIVVDTSGLTDTSLTVGPLQAKKYHYWRVQAVNEYGHGLWSMSFRFKTSDLSGMDNRVTLPLSLKLAQNYPNPFNPRTTIPFTVDKSSHIMINIYDIRGRKVKELFNKTVEAGKYAVPFDGYNLASGIYIYELRTNNVSLKRKMTLIK